VPALTWRIARANRVIASVMRLGSDAVVEPTPEEVEHRRRWFDWYIEQQEHNSVRRPAKGGPYLCPCCGCWTLDERGMSDICPVCFWEDDGQDDHDADVVRGGPNRALSLSVARANYLQFGACEMKMVENVRPPRPEELPKTETA
jgi:hypothetical protein